MKKRYKYIFIGKDGVPNEQLFVKNAVLKFEVGNIYKVTGNFYTPKYTFKIGQEVIRLVWTKKFPFLKFQKTVFNGYNDEEVKEELEKTGVRFAVWHARDFLNVKPIKNRKVARVNIDKIIVYDPYIPKAMVNYNDFLRDRRNFVKKQKEKELENEWTVRVEPSGARTFNIKKILQSEKGKKTIKDIEKLKNHG